MNLLERLGLVKAKERVSSFADGVEVDYDISGPAAGIDLRYRDRKVIERHRKDGSYSIVVDGREFHLGPRPSTADALAQGVMNSLAILADRLP